MFRIVAATTVIILATLTSAPDVEAQSKTKSALRECKTKGADGKLHKWKCKAEQPCCFNASISKGVCGSPIIGCF